MGLMDPEELSCSGVGTDKGTVINSSKFPDEIDIQLERNGHLNSFNDSEESNNSLALNIVSEILDESIEIFNKADEVNVENNNACQASYDNSSNSDHNVTHDICDLSKKTDLDEIRNNVELLNEVSVDDSCRDNVNTAADQKLLDYDTNEDGIFRCSEHSEFYNEPAIIEADNLENSTDDDDSTSSPLISGNSSIASNSNENILVRFSDIAVGMASDTISSFGLTACGKYSEIALSQESEPQRMSSTTSSIPINDEYFVVPSVNASENVDCSVDSGLNHTNGSSDLHSGNIESNSDRYSIYSEPATLPVSEFSCLHDCLIHPDVLQIQREHTETLDTLQIYKEKAERLDDCLLDLEKMLDKVSLLEEKICHREMELELCKQEKEIESKTLTSLRHETTSKIESLKKQYDQANKEKENMVMRYAKSEKELLDMKKDKITLLKQMKDHQKENENVLSKLRVLSEDKSRLAVTLDNKNMELSTAYKEVDKLKEDINSRDIKIKWIQNKLIGEMDLHKDCPDKIENLNKHIIELEKKLDEGHMEMEKCKKNIQELEAIKVLEGQVREEQAKLILERHDQSERVIKLKALQLKTDALIEENNNLSLQVQNLEVERFDLDKRLSESRQEAQEAANNLADLRSKLVEFDSISNQLTQEKERLEKTNEEVERLRKANEELMQDMSTCRAREAEMLSFTQKLTTKNVQLQSEFSNIESRAGELMLEAEKSETVADTLRRDVKNLKEELETERSKRLEDRNLLAREVAEGRAKITNLESQLADMKSNLHSASNKHQALIRELQRELQVCHRRLEQEGKVVQNSSVQYGGTPPNQSGSNGQSSPAASSSLTSSLNSIPDATIVQPSHQLEVSPTMLVERILKLQSDTKNYQDKIEFLEDHNTTLLEELMKKRRLLHSYILREQAGALATQASDNHKLEVSKHGGIMASVYGSKATDEGMTLELSLQINHKLQAILEDTLLKNITLKENIDTLGDEIERLKKLHPS